MIVFISGGARSGKSYYAEQVAVSTYYKKRGQLYYIATAKKSDLEMKDRIRLHQEERMEEWKTIEEPYDFSAFLLNCSAKDVILVDCLTIWLSNVMFKLGYQLKKIEAAVNRWLMLAQEKQLDLIFVSNDVNEGFPFSDDGVLTYMYNLQQIHKRIVEEADQIVQVVAGLPIYWKGEGP